MKKRLRRCCHFYYSSFYLISSVFYFPGMCTYACQQTVTLLQVSLHGKCSDQLKMMDYLCKFLTSDPCIIMPRSLTKCRMELKKKVSFPYLIRKLIITLVLLYTVYYHIRMVNYSNLSYPSSPTIPLRARSFMHIIHSTSSRESLAYEHCVRTIFSPLLKITKRHAIEFQPKWKRLITHERRVTVIGA